MRISGGISPSYNVQTAVDAEQALIVTHAVTLDAPNQRCLLPMFVAASKALDRPTTLNVVADTGYSNGEHASRCEEIGIVTLVPAKRSGNPHGLFDRTIFNYQTESDMYLCPEGKTLTRKQLNRPMRSVRYEASIKNCRACPSRTLCTKSACRVVSRSIDEDALNRMNARATPAAMRMRRMTVEHPFGTIKYRIFGILACCCKLWQVLRLRSVSPSWLTTSNESSRCSAQRASSRHSTPPEMKIAAPQTPDTRNLARRAALTSSRTQSEISSVTASKVRCSQVAADSAASAY